MRHLNIGMIAPTIGGGIETQLTNVIPLLKANGHNVTVLTSNGCSLEGSEVLHVCSLPFPSKLYAFMPRLVDAVMKLTNECDLIHVHGYPCYAADLATILRNVHRRPVIITLHGSFHQYTSTLTFYEKRFHNSFMLRFAKNVDKFVAVSQAEKDIVARNGLPEQRIVVVYNGVDEKYSHLERSEYLRNMFGEGRYVLYLGRLSSSKNLSVLLRAFETVSKAMCDARLIIAGPDDGELTNLKRLAEELMIDKRVRFMGQVTSEEKSRIISSADVFVHPSVQDIFAITILEASASALPVIAFDTEGSREMILDGETGVLVKERSYGALAHAIEKSLGSESIFGTLGQNGRRYISDRFSWQKTATGLEKIYYSMV
jgi:glycosyltransferase involved in cell wall biosynthesis